MGSKTIRFCRWFKNGDHPDDREGGGGGEMRVGSIPDPEGLVVRRFRGHPDAPGTALCPMCGQTYHEHGWIDQRCGVNGGNGIVCPGDYVLTTEEGKHCAVKPVVARLWFGPSGDVGGFDHHLNERKNAVDGGSATK